MRCHHSINFALSAVTPHKTRCHVSLRVSRAQTRLRCGRRYQSPICQTDACIHRACCCRPSMSLELSGFSDFSAQILIQYHTERPLQGALIPLNFLIAARRYCRSFEFGVTPPTAALPRRPSPLPVCQEPSTRADRHKSLPLL